MSSNDDMAMLNDIQALAITAHKETGVPTAYSSFTTEADGDPLTLHASVTIMPTGGRVWSLRGTSRPYSGEERSLERLRDELVEWIIRNRKEAA